MVENIEEAVMCTVSPASLLAAASVLASTFFLGGMVDVGEWVFVNNRCDALGIDCK